MSGDTPTAHFRMKLHNLECPDCSSDVFARETAHWTPDLAEHCAGCGSDLRVALDEDPDDHDALTARVFVHEHGGDVVARLRAEVERLDMMNKVEAGVRARAQTDVVLQRVQLKNNAAQHRAEVERLTEAIEQLQDLHNGRDEAWATATGAASPAKALEALERLTRERDDEKQLRVGIVEAFAASCPRCGLPGGDQ